MADGSDRPFDTESETSLSRVRSPSIPTLAHLCSSADAHLPDLDIGILNLLCAGGLPGAEVLDLDRYLDWIEEAARKADFDTRRHWYRFIDVSTEDACLEGSSSRIAQQIWVVLRVRSCGDSLATIQLTELPTQGRFPHQPRCLTCFEEPYPPYHPDLEPQD